MGKIVCLMALMASAGLVGAETKQNPHDGSDPNCNRCHIAAPETPVPSDRSHQLPQMEAFRYAGVPMCKQCHEDRGGHIIGITLDFSVPADLPLEDNKLMCLTCHYMHGDLTTTRPRASYSFMDVLFGSERLHKSYLLRRNNANGEFCLVCH